MALAMALGCAGAFAVTEDQKLTASDAASFDQFGFSVGISGDTAIVGAFGDDSSTGSAYVYVLSNGVWSQQQKLTASDAAASDSFGVSVSVSGDTAVIGARWDDDGGTNSGSAYVFERSNGIWSQQQKLTASDAAADDSFGFSVSVSGDTAVVGAKDDDDGGTDAGSAYVFVRTNGVWIQQQKLTGGDPAALDFFGWSVSVSGDTAVVGALSDDDAGSSSGSAYVFTRSNGVWTQQQKLTASDAALGDNFGVSVSVANDEAVVGAQSDDDDGDDSGSAYVFVRSNGVWTQQQKLTAGDGAAGDQFGISVSISGATSVVGARFDDDGGTDSGSAYVFARNNGVWIQQTKLTASDAAASDFFGYSVSVSGDAVVVGAFLDDDAGSASGSTYTYSVDFAAPTADTITPNTTGPTNAVSVDFTVEFSEDVVNFDAASDVVVSHAGTTSSGVAISGGPSVYTVTVENIGGNGSFTVAVDPSSDVEDAAGNALTTSVTSAAVVIDTAAPGVGIGTPSASATNTGPVSYTVTYTGADVVNLTSGDVTLNTTGTATGSVGVTNGATATPTVEISGISGDGTLGISIGAVTAVDIAGNGAPGAGPSATVTVDNTAPAVTVDTLTTSDSSPALSGTVDDPAATVSVTVDGQTNPATNLGNGTWSLADNTLAILPAGIYDVQVTATDALGNAGNDATVGELVIASDGPGNGGVITASLPSDQWIAGATLTLMAPGGGTGYAWTKNGLPLANDPPRLTGANGAMLTFDALEESDSGVYTVAYENGGQKSIVETAAFTLTVLPDDGGSLPPGAPTAGAASLLAAMAAMAAAAAVRMRRSA